ncbi:hypothetical protein ABT289_17725 [Streptomyces fimicarius]|uniref:hypothetical protein n=1 Tax=Streptomyces griseus TaxID=1911 RepID=UPI00331BEA76
MTEKAFTHQRVVRGGDELVPGALAAGERLLGAFERRHVELLGPLAGGLLLLGVLRRP